MNCDRARQLISESFERRLTPAELNEVNRHLDMCAECARFEHALRSGLHGLERLPEIAPSPELWEAVHTQSALGPGITPGRVFRQASGMLGAAVAVALVAALTIFLFQNHGETTNTPSQQQNIAAGTVASPSVTPAITTAFAEQAPFVPVATPDISATPRATRTATPISATASPAITVTTPSPAPKIDEKTAEDTVVGYFHAINLQDYETAYAYLGSSLQQQQSLQDFTRGYEETDHDTLTITATKPDSSGSMVVTIYLNAKQTDGSVRHYHGEYVVGYEGGVAKIVDATVVEDVATPSPTTAAQQSSQPCQAGGLSASADYQGATGSMAGSIIFTNNGSETCTLQGTAKVQILGPDGQVMTTVQKTSSLDGSQQPVLLRPNGQASLFFVWSNWCPPGVAETSSASPVAAGISLKVALGDNQDPITVPVRHSTGDPVTLVPRCDAPGSASTLSVAMFKTYPSP